MSLQFGRIGRTKSLRCAYGSGAERAADEGASRSSLGPDRRPDAAADDTARNSARQRRKRSPEPVRRLRTELAEWTSQVGPTERCRCGTVVGRNIWRTEGARLPGTSASGGAEAGLGVALPGRGRCGTGPLGPVSIAEPGTAGGLGVPGTRSGAGEKVLRNGL